MSSIAITGGATGTGVFSLLAPSTSTNRTLTLPDSAGTVATAESTLAQFNASGSAPVYACRAWVNFNGTGTVAIRSSGNVSSISDNGVGDYTVNFATAMPDANYAGVFGSTWDGTAGNNVALSGPTNNGTKTTTAFQVAAVNPASNARLDPVSYNIAIFR